VGQGRRDVWRPKGAGWQAFEVSGTILRGGGVYIRRGDWVRAGERDWRQWMARHGPAALLYARQITGNYQDAQDAVHDGFIKFWRHRGVVREGAGLFLAAVRTAALNQRRSAGRRERREQARGMNEAAFEPPVEGMARQEELERALAGLREAQREVVVLKIWGGLTFAEAAECLGESPNTVAGRYRSAIERLTELLVPKVEHER
jgi:RNA polymerase sigma-70 factor, ECF subfamily